MSRTPHDVKTLRSDIPISLRITLVFPQDGTLTTLHAYHPTCHPS